MPHPPFIRLEENSELPLYRQIYETIRQAILSGKFSPMMPLPASRLLAKQLGISRMTVVNAYDQLIAEGYIESKIGAGTHVAAHLPEEFLNAADVESGENKAKPTPPKIQLSAYGKHLEKNRDEILRRLGASLSVPFQNGVPAVDKFPFEVWSKIAHKLRKKPPSELLGYHSPAGFEPLRAAIAAHLESTRGVICAPEQIIIINGTQQGLDLISRVFLEAGSEVWIEDPSYAGTRAVFAASGAKLVPVPIDEQGFDILAARRKSKKARLVYVTPSYQYPLGVIMSLARRMNLLEWARETGSFIVEDDYNSEYRYEGRPLASLQGLDRDGRVIYIGTFSKTIFPALRLGCLVVPRDLAEVFAAAHALNDYHSPAIDQAVLAEFIAERHFARHVRRTLSIYKERQRFLVAEAKKHLKRLLEVAPAEAGMHLIGWLPEGVSDTDVSLRAAEMGLRVTALSPLCINEKLRGGLILGYTAFDEKQIRQGVKNLKRVIQEFI